MILLKQMIVLFIVMMVGMFLAKKDVFDRETSKKMSWLIVNICNPCLMLSSVMGESRVGEDVFLMSVKAAFFMYLVLLILGLFMPGILKDKTNKAYSLMTVFGNTGFMGYPIIEAMYGQEALLLGAVFNLFFGLLMYTYGIMVISGEKFSFKNLKLLLNSGFIAGIAAMIIYLGKIHVPEIIGNSIEMVSDITAPLSMMVIGATFADLSIGKLIKDVRILSFSFIRLILIPLAFYPFLNYFIKDQVLLGVCLIILAVPVGSMNVMMVEQYGGNIETSSKGVALTTVLSVVTMPLIFYILM